MRELMGPRRACLAALGLTLAVGCGAKTGLLVPDGGVDAPPDAAVPPDAGACPDQPVPLVRRNVQTVLMIDRSGSMGTTWDGRPGGIGLPTRWELARATAAAVLPAYEDRLLLGAKLFPSGLGCAIEGGLDVEPQPNGVDDILALFDTFVPEGGTPAATALELVLDDLDPDALDPTVVVLAMDGGPNCNPEVPADPETCVCTSTRAACVRAPSNCLDDPRMLDVLREGNEVRGVPSVVIGIDDPSRPDLTSYLDEMAVAGGLPRSPEEPLRFYSAREPEDLTAAFERIAEVISRCVLSVPVPPPADAVVRVTVNGEPLPRDPARADGWDWTDEARGAMGFFGRTCDLLQAGDPDIRAEVDCDPLR